MIDNKVMKYIPKKLHAHVTACDRFENFEGGYTYNVLFDYAPDAKEGETSIMANGIEGLKWACKQVLSGQRGVIYG
jgi:hypothetical protein